MCSDWIVECLSGSAVKRSEVCQVGVLCEKQVTPQLTLLMQHSFNCYKSKTIKLPKNRKHLLYPPENTDSFSCFPPKTRKKQLPSPALSRPTAQPKRTADRPEGYWVDEMHVDGFRFDLASALTRGNDGKAGLVAGKGKRMEDFYNTQV